MMGGLYAWVISIHSQMLAAMGWGLSTVYAPVWCELAPPDDSLLYDHDFDAEDTVRRCEEAVHCRAARAVVVWAY